MLKILGRRKTPVAQLREPACLPELLDTHDISIPALGVFTAPSRRDSQTVSFPDRGSYPFVCTYHPDTMRGIVTVQ